MVDVQTEFGTVRVPRGGRESAISFEVYTTSVGMLFCYEHSTAWCDDIEQSIRHGQDSGFIFTEFEEKSQRRIYVPLLPTTWRIYAQVAIEQCDRDTFKAYLVQGNKRYVSTLAMDGGIFIGLLGRGDGRLALRSMILDWVSLQSAVKRCHSALHTRERNREMREIILKDERAKIAHTWCLHWYNKCAWCTLEEGPELNFDPDLVPNI